MTKTSYIIVYYKLEVFFMRVKVFDCNHEMDLEDAINKFFEENEDIEIIDIKYQLSIMYDYKEQEQIYCYSALILYKE